MKDEFNPLIADDGFCPVCGECLNQEWENNGFEPPDPTHYEVVRVYCEHCGYEE